MKLTIAAIGIGLLFNSTFAFAEQGCPDGFMPNAAGTPGLQCIQIPGQTRPGMDVGAQAEPNWETRWGAIAYDPEHGSVGISSEQTSRRKAVKGALAHCKSKGGVACALNIAYYNQCVAVVSGPSPAGSGVLMNSASAVTKQEAEKLSTETCVKDTQAKCTTFYTGCSYPVRGD